MIGYVTVGTNDFGKALASYGALFETTGIKPVEDWSYGSLGGPSRGAGPEHRLAA